MSRRVLWGLAVLGVLPVLVAKKKGKKQVNVVPYKNETLTRAEARDYFERAFADTFGREPSIPEEAMLLAQSAHETAQWKKMPGWNWGGLKGSGNLGTMSARTREGSGAGVTVTDGFRAYTDPLAGALDWLSLLKRRYGAALAAAASGDVEAFVRGLKKVGYFTGDVAPYVASVRASGKKWVEELGGKAVSPPPLPATAPVYFSLAGWRRASDGELTPEQRSLAKVYLGELTKLGTYKVDNGALYAAETHSNAARGISVFLPVESNNEAA